jgi:acyl dehydratase
VLTVAMVERLAQYATTAKQQEFEWDFTQGVEGYETWDEIEIGRSGPGARVFEVAEEDILAFNRSCLETDPLLVDPEYAAAHGGLRQHPLFVVQVVFYCIDTGIGSWLRSPGARNPGQRIELFEPFSIGEQISATITHRDKWIRRDKNYVEDQVDLHNQDGVLKATWFTRLILPPDRAELIRYASM